MRQEAVKMILGMVAVAVLITAISGSPLAIVIVAVVSYVVWLAAKGFDGYCRDAVCPSGHIDTVENALRCCSTLGPRVAGVFGS